MSNMNSSEQSRRFAFFHGSLKRIVTNSTFQWFVGLMIGVSGVIIALLSYMQDRSDVATKPIDQADPPPSVEHSVAKEYYTLIEHQSLFTQEARTNLSVSFQNIEGEEFVSLNIAPTGKDASVRAVFKGYTEEFTSSSGIFNVQVLDIDYRKRKVAIRVSRKK
ncbi:MAG: hypothetical protein Q3M30_06255 [Candidatus Electrothrix sp. Rat3]|nr:hypothetical protein [Candidatus Electrothrix rattekaaiensis]